MCVRAVVRNALKVYASQQACVCENYHVSSHASLHISDQSCHARPPTHAPAARTAFCVELSLPPAGASSLLRSGVRKLSDAARAAPSALTKNVWESDNNNSRQRWHPSAGDPVQIHHERVHTEMVKDIRQDAGCHGHGLLTGEEVEAHREGSTHGKQWRRIQPRLSPSLWLMTQHCEMAMGTRARVRACVRSNVQVYKVVLILRLCELDKSFAHQSTQPQEHTV